MSKLRSNCGGISIVLLWSMIFFIVMLVCVFAIDVYYANVKAEIAKDAVTMAAMSVYKDIDKSQLESGEVVLGQQAVNTFKSYLAKNMKLNSDLSATPYSIAMGQVQIDQFILYTKSSSDQVYPDGSNIYYKPSIFVRVKFDIEPILKGIVGGRKTVYSSAHADLISDTK